MKADVFFILDSFNFNGSVEGLIDSLTEAAAIVEKMESDKFIRFSKSSDFYDNAISKLYGPNAIPESGLLASLIYDGSMNKAKSRDFNSANVIDCVNKELPVEDNHWLSIYGLLPMSINISEAIRNVNNEEDIVSYSKIIVLSNNLSDNDYAEAFEGIYRNLIFHPDYNDIGNITSGCNQFIKGIFEMFDVINAFKPKDGDVKSDISDLDKSIKFTTCEEGGGKKKRTTEDKKLDFEFDIDGSKSNYNCEYHCKLEYVDNQHKVGKYHKDNRMYFGFYKPNSEKKANKILIAHLGDHL